MLTPQVCSEDGLIRSSRGYKINIVLTSYNNKHTSSVIASVIHSAHIIACPNSSIVSNVFTKSGISINLV